MKRLAPQVGLEPTTLRLTAECSAIELLRSDQAGNCATEVDFTANSYASRQSEVIALLNPWQIPCQIFDHCFRGTPPGGQRALDRGRFTVVATHIDASRAGHPHRSLLPLGVTLLGQRARQRVGPKHLP